MKSLFLLLPFLYLAQAALRVQVADPMPPEAAASAIKKPGIFDALAVVRQLLVAPKVSPVPVPPGQPLRFYEPESGIVMVQDQNQIRELPYVTLPMLFVRETPEPPDAESRAALEELASVIRTVSVVEPKALFDIEGHTSMEGTEEVRMALSRAFAQRMHDELTQHHGVPAHVLSAHGYGASFATHPNGTAEQRAQDRRVLVVRTR